MGNGTGRIYAGLRLTIRISVRGRPDVRCVVKYWDNYYGTDYFKHTFRDVPYLRDKSKTWSFLSGRTRTASVRHCHFL